MKRTLKMALLGLTLATAAGCQSTFLSTAVNHYCAVPANEREANRILVNASIAPNSVAVTCAE